MAIVCVLLVSVRRLGSAVYSLCLRLWAGNQRHIHDVKGYSPFVVDTTTYRHHNPAKTFRAASSPDWMQSGMPTPL